MRQTTPEMEAIWRSGDFMGENRPIARVTVQRARMKLRQFTGTSTFSRKKPSTSGMADVLNESSGIDPTRGQEIEQTFADYLFSATLSPRPLPNVRSVKWTRSVDADIAECTVQLWNTRPLAVGEVPSEEDFDEPGFYTYNRGRSAFSSVWNHEPNEWATLMMPDNIMRTYEGYGVTADPNDSSGFMPPERDPKLMLTGTWIIDDVEMSADGIITLKARDMGRLLVDHIAWLPVVPMDFYPLSFQSWGGYFADGGGTTGGGGGGTGGGGTGGGGGGGGTTLPLTSLQEIKLSPSTNSNTDPTAVLNGHSMEHAFDGDPATYWLSTGVSSPTEGAVVDETPPEPVADRKFAGHWPGLVRIGMATPAGNPPPGWNEARSIVGQPISEARRFTGSWVNQNDFNQMTGEADAANALPFISFKVPGGSTGAGWSRTASGQDDAGLVSWFNMIVNYGKDILCSVEHEPTGSSISDADLCQWARMQIYLTYWFAGYRNCTVGQFSSGGSPTVNKGAYNPAHDITINNGGNMAWAPIPNGFVWRAEVSNLVSMRKAMCPPALVTALNECKGLLCPDFYDVDYVNHEAAYTNESYRTPGPGVRTSEKIAKFIAWQRSVGLNASGCGEYGCIDGADMLATWAVMRKNRDVWCIGNYFNSGQNSDHDWRLVPANFPDYGYVSSKTNNSGQGFRIYGGNAQSQGRLDAFISTLIEANADAPLASPASVTSSAYEWIEGLVADTAVAEVRVQTIKKGYTAFVSVMVDGAWQGASKIAYTGTNGADIPYVTSSLIGSESEVRLGLGRSWAAVQRVRVTFFNLQDFGVASGGQRYRVGVASLRGYAEITATSTETPPAETPTTETPTTETPTTTVDPTYVVDGELRPGAPAFNPGRIYDYTDIVKLFCVWAGFFWAKDAHVWHSDATQHLVAYNGADDILGNTGRVWGDFQNAGTANPAEITSDVFDKKPLMDGISYVRDILGFLFTVDETGAVVWRLPNLYEVGNWISGASPNPGRSQRMHVIDERVQLMDLTAKISSANVREGIFVGSVVGNCGATVGGFNPNRTGLRRWAGWTDQNFESSTEAKVMADMIAVRQMFEYRTDNVQIPGFPGIQIDDQVRVLERVTSEGFIHYVKGISSTLDLEEGVWTYDLQTHWLGDDVTNDRWVVRQSQLAQVTQNYLGNVRAQAPFQAARLES